MHARVIEYRVTGVCSHCHTAFRPGFERWCKLDKDILPDVLHPDLSAIS